MRFSSTFSVYFIFVIRFFHFNLLKWLFYIMLTYFLFWSFCFFRTSSPAYGGSQARGPIRGCWPMPQPQHFGIWAMSATYPTAQGNAWSLTHWVRPGIKPMSSWMLVGFANHRTMMGTSLCWHIFWCWTTLAFLESPHFIIAYCKRHFLSMFLNIFF